MNRGGFLRNFYVRNVSDPERRADQPLVLRHPARLADRLAHGGGGAGAVVTFDCDYTPRADNVRIRPPEVRNVHISNVRVGNVKTKDGKQAPCYQAIVILGPVASDYNGPAPRPEVLPVRDVTITDCDFGTPANAYNVRKLKLA
jgi:polygalacturonase